MLRPAHLDASWIGQTLPWNLYTEAGVLVAVAGMVVNDEAHYLRLVARPLFRAVDRSEIEAPGVAPGVERLHALTREADVLLAPPYGAYLAEQILDLVRALSALYDDDPEMCLGHGRLVSLARPAVQHCLQVLFTCRVLADPREFDDARLARLLGAALTMNLADLAFHDHCHQHAGALPEADRAILRGHPIRAVAALIEGGVEDEAWLTAVRQHHESMDGSGYPDGLPGEAISLEARLLRIADVYCAKLGGRYYRPPRSPRIAMQALFGPERRHLDEQFASRLMHRVGLNPPGTLVRLANGECACVTRLGRGGEVRRVMSFLDARGHLLEFPQERDVSQPAHSLHGYLTPDPAWPVIDWKRLWRTW